MTSSVNDPQCQRGWKYSFQIRHLLKINWKSHIKRSLHKRIWTKNIEQSDIVSIGMMMSFVWYPQFLFQISHLFFLSTPSQKVNNSSTVATNKSNSFLKKISYLKRRRRKKIKGNFTHLLLWSVFDDKSRYVLNRFEFFSTKKLSRFYWDKDEREMVSSGEWAQSALYIVSFQNIDSQWLQMKVLQSEGVL